MPIDFTVKSELTQGFVLLPLSKNVLGLIPSPGKASKVSMFPPQLCRLPSSTKTCAIWSPHKKILNLIQIILGNKIGQQFFFSFWQQQDCCSRLQTNYFALRQNRHKLSVDCLHNSLVFSRSLSHRDVIRRSLTTDHALEKEAKVFSNASKPAAISILWCVTTLSLVLICSTEERKKFGILSQKLI